MGTNLLRRGIGISFAIVTVAFCAWFYFAPHLAVIGMKSAAESEDAAKLSAYVDFAALRDSLKTDLNARVASGSAKEKGKNPLNTLGAAMGSVIGTVTATAFVGPTVDALVTPENLARMIKGGGPPSASNDAPPRPVDPEPDISMYYENFNRFVVIVKKRNSNEAPVGLVFDRYGAFSWKLAALRLPM